MDRRGFLRSLVGAAAGCMVGGVAVAATGHTVEHVGTTVTLPEIPPYFNGRVGHYSGVVIYDRMLTRAEVRALYSEGYLALRMEPNQTLHADPMWELYNDQEKDHPRSVWWS